MITSTFNCVTKNSPKDYLQSITLNFLPYSSAITQYPFLLRLGSSEGCCVCSHNFLYKHFISRLGIPPVLQYCRQISIIKKIFWKLLTHIRFLHFHQLTSKFFLFSLSLEQFYNSFMLTKSCSMWTINSG